jgi:hypothetical protein
MVDAMNVIRLGLLVALVLLTAACLESTTSPNPSLSAPEASDVAPDVEPSATPEAPLPSRSPVAPNIEPSQTPEPAMTLSPMPPPVAPSEAPETPIL